MNTNETVEALNSLIEINNDRIEGYQRASDETTEIEMKRFFADLSATSRKCKAELSNEVVKLGGTPTDATRTSGKFFRMWMDIKATLTGKDTKAILNSCEFGEDAAVEAYKEVLDSPADLPTSLVKLVENQYELIIGDHNRVKVMRNSTH